MAKNIDNGIQRLLKQKKSNEEAHVEQTTKQWRQLRNQLDTLLSRTNIITVNEAQQKCNQLDNKTLEERRTFINETWGPIYVQKADPLLVQLDLIEKHLATV